LAPDGQNASDLTLVGIADPQQQGGNAATTATAAKLGPPNGTGRPLEPAPALGFSGAAALDPRGRLVGVALLKLAAMAGPTYVVSQALFVPAEDIRALLNGRNLAPANGPSGLDAAKAAVVRVICVRK
jgi:hypothetical protein